ncbi:MAG: ABC transporter substrate-binding protein [Candidatus Latescibacteria bacterium]|nr:ABC transporter substrate-binding protein [Candidatus Latescibacterota bacterium]NIM65788.1 ABC transporter substrate-binding protein [Candidatus Latescibacterota bacterium]NIO02281.1 ABC transporter substrate-binding protein [Candidatus Latescibacterota bacterium]
MRSKSRPARSQEASFISTRPWTTACSRKYGLKPEHIYIRGSGISLAAVAANEVQFLYCAADATLPGLATGVEAKLVAAPLVKLPYVLVARSDIKRPEDLKGKVIGVTRPGDLSARLSRTLVRRLNFAPDEVTIRPIGGSQSERYQAMATGVVHAIIVTPPLDVRAKNDGFNVVYRLIELDLPFIYSSVHASSKMLRERPEVVQKVVAAFAEALHFVEKNPDKAKGSIGKALKLKDEVALQAAYQAYAKDIIDRWMAVSGKAVGEAVELAREGGTNVRKKPEELYDNSFTADLEKSGFLKELWGSELQKPAR